VPNFKASRSWVQRWTQRHNLTSVVLHGAGGSVNLEVTEERMATIRGIFQDFQPENIFNMDGTGLFYRCLPKRSFVPAEQRRVARGTKSMKAKKRVTIVLAFNATGSKKVPVAIIGKAAPPLCFRRPGCASPLPYFSQRSSWMDGVVFKKWVYEVFLPFIRLHTTEKVALVVDNLASHDGISDDQLVLIALPPNTTAIFQPLDACAIAALKLLYKRRFLSAMVEHLDGLRSTTGFTRTTATLANSVRVSLLDVTRIIQDEWAKTTPESLARCWNMARCFPAPMQNALTALYTDYHRADTAPVANAVTDISPVLLSATLADGLFPETQSEDLISGVSSWLGAEENVGILEDTVDMVLGGGEGEDQNE